MKRISFVSKTLVFIAVVFSIISFAAFAEVPLLRSPVQTDNLAAGLINAKQHSTPEYDFVEGIVEDENGNAGKKNAKQTRRIMFVKIPGFWVVSDIFTPKDKNPHTYQIQWNLASEHTEGYSKPYRLADDALITTDSGVTNIAVVPLPVLDGDDAKVSVVHIPREAEIPNPGLAATFLLTKANVTGEQRFLTLILPLKVGQGNPIDFVKSSIYPGAPQPYYDAMAGLRDGSDIIVTQHGASGGLQVSFLPPAGKARTMVGGSGRKTKATAIRKKQSRSSQKHLVK